MADALTWRRFSEFSAFFFYSYFVAVSRGPSTSFGTPIQPAEYERFFSQVTEGLQGRGNPREARPEPVVSVRKLSGIQFASHGSFCFYNLVAF